MRPTCVVSVLPAAYPSDMVSSLEKDGMSPRDMWGKNGGTKSGRTISAIVIQKNFLGRISEALLGI